MKKLVVCKRGHLMSKYRKEHPNGDTYCYKCKIIRYNKNRLNFPEKHKLYCKKSRIKKMYGITLEEALSIFIQQDYKCAICKEFIDKDSKRWHIDHNHKTDKVRGILCHNCNTAIGLLKENKETVKSILNYL